MNTPPASTALARRAAGLIIALPLLMLAACASPTPPPIPLDPTRTPRPTRTPIPESMEQPTATLDAGKESVGEYEVYMRCVGEGSPVVIIEADVDQPGTSSNWAKVSREIGFTTRTCSYDRANLGRSDKVEGARTSEAIAADLHGLLESSGIEGPYILVGHALGSWHARVFAQKYPDEVVGMVLVQPTHPDLYEASLEALPPASEAEDIKIRVNREGWANPNSYYLQSAEHFDYVTSLEQVRVTGPFGELPIIIVSVDPTIVEATPPLPAHIQSAINRVRDEFQVAHLTLSTNTEHWIAEGAQYVIQMEEPQVIVDAVLTLVERARGQHP